jgi:hypothetical protein
MIPGFATSQDWKKKTPLGLHSYVEDNIIQLSCYRAVKIKLKIKYILYHIILFYFFIS